jgi:uncharacterized integral membrane protein (TIGR00698 family)
MLARVLLILAVLACLLPWVYPPASAYVTPPNALALGIVLALLGQTAWPSECKKYSRIIIQTGIVAIGLWISLPQIARAGLLGLALSSGAIVVSIVFCLLLEKLIKPPKDVSTLLSAGTAICGGSAIAATGTVIGATSAAIAVSTAVVFILNAIGVYTYPHIGHALNLSDTQYGAWCAIGVHDVAGVLAAAKGYSPGDKALEYATIIKLTRVLWIVPTALVLGWLYRRSQHTQTKAAKAPFPYFVIFFVLACGVRYLLDKTIDAQLAHDIGETAKKIATTLMTIALLLIGTGISLAAVRSVGWRALATGVVLWIMVSASALLAIRALM